MFSTSLAVAALSGLLATGSLAGSNSWQTDYRAALQLSASQQKPLVVVIRSGGASQLFQNPTAPQEALNVVRQSYIGLSVDPQTAQGRQLAELFRMQEGLVISDKTGNVQALRYEGTLEVPQVTTYLTRYAASSQPPVQTEYVYPAGHQANRGLFPNLGSGQPGIFQQPGPINNLITRPVGNVFNATRSLVIGGG